METLDARHQIRSMLANEDSNIADIFRWIEMLHDVYLDVKANENNFTLANEISQLIYKLKVELGERVCEVLNTGVTRL